MNTFTLGTFLQSRQEPGYQFQKTLNAGSWIVAIQGPTMKQAWSVAIGVTQAQGPANGSSPAIEFVSIGTTLWRGKSDPSREVMGFLLQMNTLDNNIGSLSIYKNAEGESFIQYFVRTPMLYLSEDQVIFNVAYVGGFADTISEKLKTFE